MQTNKLLNRITVDQGVLSGKPVIKGTRLSVQYILGLMASGADTGEILTEYTHLTHEDILACLLFASKTLDDFTYVPLNKQSA